MVKEGTMDNVLLIPCPFFFFFLLLHNSVYGTPYYPSFVDSRPYENI